MRSLDQSRETFELRFTPRLLVGLRYALLEAITDLIYAGSAERQDLARHALTYMSQVVHDPGSLPESQTGVLSIRSASVDSSDLVLEATREVLGMLANAVDHVQGSLLEFEIPIRVKLDPVELAGLGRMLEEYASAE
jgi:hypothetical protein